MLLNMPVKDFMDPTLRSLKNSECMPSGPGAFTPHRLLIAALISSVIILGPDSV